MEYYVDNAISLVGAFGITVRGYEGLRAPQRVTRAHVIVAAPGSECFISKWMAMQCIVPYNARVHRDAITERTGPSFLAKPPLVAEREKPRVRSQAHPIHISETDDIEFDDDDDDDDDDTRAVKRSNQASPIPEGMGKTK